MVDRNPDGTFKKGTTPNPGGRPATAHIREYIREATNDYKDIIDKLIDIATSSKYTVSNRLTAIKELLDRGLGKPLQTIDADITMPEPIQFVPFTVDNDEKDTSN